MVVLFVIVSIKGGALFENNFKKSKLRLKALARPMVITER